MNRSKAKDILEVNRPAWNQSVFIEGAVKCDRQNRQMSAVSVALILFQFTNLSCLDMYLASDMHRLYYAYNMTV